MARADHQVEEMEVRLSELQAEIDSYVDEVAELRTVNQALLAEVQRLRAPPENFLKDRLKHSVWIYDNLGWFGILNFSHFNFVNWHRLCPHVKTDRPLVRFLRPESTLSPFGHPS